MELLLTGLVALALTIAAFAVGESNTHAKHKH